MSKFQHLLANFYEELGKSLPGEAAHLKMTPYKRINAAAVLKSDLTPKIASTLLLLHEGKDDIHFTLIKRPNYNGAHGGQISFPGGKLEENESVKDAAIRETEEEIGILKHDINILGTLTQVYIPPSNFLISPFIGYLDQAPKYHPDFREVEQIIEVPLSELLDERLVKTKKIAVPYYGGEDFFIEAPYYELQNHVVWGATAYVLSEFKDIVKRVL